MFLEHHFSFSCKKEKKKKIHKNKTQKLGDFAFSLGMKLFPWQLAKAEDSQVSATVFLVEKSKWNDENIWQSS